MGGEEGQQLELLEGERDLGPVGPDPPLVVIEPQPGQRAAGLAGGSGPAGWTAPAVSTAACTASPAAMRPATSPVTPASVPAAVTG